MNTHWGEQCLTEKNLLNQSTPALIFLISLPLVNTTVHLYKITLFGITFTRSSIYMYIHLLELKLDHFNKNIMCNIPPGLLVGLMSIAVGFFVVFPLSSTGASFFFSPKVCLKVLVNGTNSNVELSRLSGSALKYDITSSPANK